MRATILLMARCALVLSFLALAALTPGVAAADVLPPPTLVLDALYLGPLGIGVWIVLLAAAVLTFRALRRRGRGRGLAIGLAILVFVVGDLAVYAAVISLGRSSRARFEEVR